MYVTVYYILYTKDVEHSLKSKCDDAFFKKNAETADLCAASARTWTWTWTLNIKFELYALTTLL